MRVAISKVMSLAAAALCLAAGGAAAQAAQRGYVSVAAHDSTGAPIPAAEVTVTHGIRNAVAHGVTDSAGHTLLMFDVRDSSDLQVTVRKIGYPRSDYFFSAGPRDTAIVQLVLAPEGRRSPPSPSLGEDEPQVEELSHRHGRHRRVEHVRSGTAGTSCGACGPTCSTSRGGCDTSIQNVWVNGKRIIASAATHPRGGSRGARRRRPARARYTYAAVRRPHADCARAHPRS